jgi:hypothetical protein
MSKYFEEEQIEQYINLHKHKQQSKKETISKKDLLKVFDDNLNKLEKETKNNNLLFNFQMLRDLIEFNKII